MKSQTQRVCPAKCNNITCSTHAGSSETRSLIALKADVLFEAIDTTAIMAFTSPLSVVCSVSKTHYGRARALINNY